MEFSFLFSTFYLVGGSPRPVPYTQKTFFDFTVFYFLFFRGLFFLGWILVFCFLLSIWLGAPLGLCLIPKKLFSILLFSIFYFFVGCSF